MNDLGLDVSRETLDRLHAYVALLEKWNPHINLVARSTLSRIWERHFVDSAQIFGYAPEYADHWVDLGSGGGFPGLVVATLSLELRPDMQVTLVESDTRKATFLRTVIRELGLKATVIDQRIEAIRPLNADVLSARALADLTMLLSFADQHLSETGIALFPKGATWEKEVQDALQTWRFSSERFTSKTESEAVVLRIREVSHV
ncbi:16S rRNA (guanine(527)-N(7))-methyltransferase RsmG [Thalassobius sp. Cn5-15]|uniref:16S rRNA (guanine(527)-N(7))-methyltransferase RsmG n=1 Tax=Thalassobius sp. Cn5-15 TaxID=2917763 RepID=UPI001EF238CC|nr:16S rRNA (guanine(527)-N(7))-methyltransferase RsmG [Thalassobius sp. Cn5-15]